MLSTAPSKTGSKHRANTGSVGVKQNISRRHHRSGPDIHNRSEWSQARKYTAASLPLPPDDDDKYAYLRKPQARWVFAVSALAAIGVAFSMFGVATQSNWTLFFLAPLALFIVEQAISLRTSTYKRAISFKQHRETVVSWAPKKIPSVDVFLPTAGEELHVIENTYRHVAELRWSGLLNIYVLDDSSRSGVATMAQEYGFHYMTRDGSDYKKAGNLQNAFAQTGGDHILILDADFVPRADLLTELVPYMDDETVGIVQSPQYFDSHMGLSWLERTAGATQELFYRMIQPSRDRVSAAICVGTSAIYRRSALQTIGGFPLIGHSEDVYTGVLLQKEGFRLRYVPVLVSRGRCPDEVDAFIAQQYRWCEGSMSLAMDASFHGTHTMTVRQRLSYWAGFLYYISTALNSILAPLPIIIMIYMFPDDIAPSNILPLLAAIVLWTCVLPITSHTRWRPEVLRVQSLYGFAHLICICDMLRHKTAEWVATGSQAKSSSVASRIRPTVVFYTVATQALTIIGLATAAARLGLGNVWAHIGLAAFTAYISLPVAWLLYKQGSKERYVAHAVHARPAGLDLVTELAAR